MDLHVFFVEIKYKVSQKSFHDYKNQKAENITHGHTSFILKYMLHIQVFLYIYTINQFRRVLISFLKGYPADFSILPMF